MTINTITLLPTPVPSRADPLNFATRADAFLGALPTFGTELNSFATSANALAVDVENNKIASQAILDESITVQDDIQSLYDSTIAINNFKGLWSSLTGALVRPASVYHNGSYWILLVDLANVATSTPSTGNSNWLRSSFLASDINYVDTNTGLGATDVQQAIEKVWKISERLDNILINPDFKIDQENSGAVVSIPVSATRKYIVDQWYSLTTGATLTAQQVAGIGDQEYSLKFFGATSNTGFSLVQRIEASSCIALKNKTTTLSLRARASSSRTITWTVSYAVAKDDFTTVTQIATGTFNVTTALNTFTVSFNAGANAVNGLKLSFSNPALLAGATMEYDQIQLEASPSATSFKGRHTALELMLCQRYFEGGSAYKKGTHNNAGGDVVDSLLFKVNKRATPTIAHNFTLSNGSAIIISYITQTGFAYGFTTLNTNTVQLNGYWTASARL